MLQASTQSSGRPAKEPMDEDPQSMTRVTIVDGNNVMGSVPDGWWRERGTASRRLLDRVVCLASRIGERVMLVLDREYPGLEPGCYDGVEVLYPVKPGKDGADRRILELVDEMQVGAALEVVTSDRWLRHQVESRKVPVSGSGSFLDRLERKGC